MTRQEAERILADIETKMGRQFVEDLRSVAASLRLHPLGSPEANEAVQRAATLYFSLDSEDAERLVVLLPALKEST